MGNHASGAVGGDPVMIRQMAVFGFVLGAAAVSACDGSPQVPPAVLPSPSPLISPVLPVPPASSPELYTLTLGLDASCTVVPEQERTRKYTATLQDLGEGRRVVTLSDARFLGGPICTAGSGSFSGLGCN
jgi:hypothetical protein